LIEIDGSQGEGGGQILRTSLTLSACLGKPITIRNIRGNRRVAGLRPQHVTAVRAVAQICGVQTEELTVGQTMLVFRPGPIKAGTYALDIGTAGSTGLILQTVALPLALADGQSLLKITGGTHNPKAPCFDYLAYAWVPLLRRIGVRISVGMPRAGFYPSGGGTLVAQIEGGTKPEVLEPMTLLERGALRSLKGAVKIANHPINIGHRMRRAAQLQMERRGLKPIEMEIEVIDAADAGGYCAIWAAFDDTHTACVGVTGKGKTPESSGADAVGGMADFLDAEKSGRAGLDPNAADHMMLPLALAGGPSRLTTSRVTRHCVTNAAVIEQVTGRSVTIEGRLDKPGTVTVS